LPATIALARAYNAQVQGNLATTVKYAELALQLIPENDFYRAPRPSVYWRSPNGPAGNLESAIRGIGDWMESMTQLGNHVSWFASAFAVADLLVGLGRLSKGRADLSGCFNTAPPNTAREADTSLAHHHLGCP